ncbi:MAG: SCO family protein [Flavisolibacter sp.]|nr:SCO family protein [Flavisolibacter sp.]
MVRKYSIWVFVAAVVLIPVSVFAVVKWYENQYTALPILGPKGHTIGEYTLLDQHGRTATLKDAEGKIVVADFFFTHCPSICPKMTYNLKRVQAYSGIANLLITSFTVDPERDSVDQLKKYAEKMEINGDWQLLTGTKQDLYRLARKSYKVIATDGDGGPNDFIHSDNLVLIDPQKRIRGYYNGTDEEAVNQLVKDIQKLSREKK